MNKQNPFDFSQLLPGFNFLSGAPGAGAALGGGPLGHWIAPTVDIEELDRRINELKTVQYWLEQNQLGIKATIQALEVQKMTLATLRGMNLNVAEVAKAFTLPAEDGEKTAAKKRSTDSDETTKTGEATGDKPVLDPMQWWGALTQQFQQIATQTLEEASRAAQNAGAEVKAMAEAAVPAAAQAPVAPAAAARKSAAPTSRKATATKKAVNAKPRAAKTAAKSTKARSAK